MSAAASPPSREVVLDVHRVGVKLFLEPPGILDADALVAVFHRWIRESAVEGVPIDVADYRHVEAGPGLVLVAHECDYRIDADGLSYVHKTRRSDAPLRDLFRRTLLACRRLEQEESLGARFRPDELRLTLVDRLSAPDRAATRADFTRAIERCVEDLFRPAPVDVDWEDLDPRRLSSLRVRCANAPALDTLIERLSDGEHATVSDLQGDDCAASPGPIVIPENLRRGLDERALDGYPDEVCGLLVGRTVDGVVHVERIAEARNLETERSSDRFTLDPGDWVRADDAARRLGLDIVGIWHTHPDHPARPSRTDLAWAWEGYSYLILSVNRDRVDAARSWRLVGQGFIEQSIEEVHS